MTTTEVSSPGRLRAEAPTLPPGEAPTPHRAGTTRLALPTRRGLYATGADSVIWDRNGKVLSPVVKEP